MVQTALIRHIDVQQCLANAEWLLAARSPSPAKAASRHPSPPGRSLCHPAALPNAAALAVSQMGAAEEYVASFLPPEILLTIFLHLDGEALQVCRRVCTT